MKWWEKTVEYYFIQKYVGNRMFVAPLDGKEEKAGDAIFSSNQKWMLIEFKRDIESINNEKKKFVDYENAKSCLQSQDSHHCIVYGKELDNVFSLEVETYFSKSLRNSIDNMLNYSVSFELFNKYLKDLLVFKQSNSGSNGSISSDSYMLVAGVSESGNIIECLSLYEFQNPLAPSLTNNADQIKNYSPPSFSPDM